MARGCHDCGKVYKIGGLPLLKYRERRLCKGCFSRAVQEDNEAIPLSEDQIKYKILIRKHLGLPPLEGDLEETDGL